MNMEQLECFTAIVKYHTFSEAAEMLNISQSSLSKKIIALEDELGIELFSRKKRQVSLTEAGTMLYKNACQILKLHKNMQKTAKDFSLKNQNALTISTLPILNQYELMEKIHRFRSQYPNTILDINELEEPDIVTGFSTGKLSLTILRKELLDVLPYAFDTWEIAQDEFVLLVSKEHPFAQKNTISMKDLKNENFILMHKYTTIYTTFLKLCEKTGFTPHILRTARLESISSSVAINEGISFMPLKSAELFHNKKTVICHFDKKIASTIVLAKPTNNKLSIVEQNFVQEFLK